jgi:hypothetical protein
VQQPPEPVREAGEVMTGHRRPNAGIDADEEHAHIRPDAIAQQRQHDRHGSCPRRTTAWLLSDADWLSSRIGSDAAS